MGGELEHGGVAAGEGVGEGGDGACVGRGGGAVVDRHVVEAHPSGRRRGRVAGGGHGDGSSRVGLTEARVRTGEGGSPLIRLSLAS